MDPAEPTQLFGAEAETLEVDAATLVVKVGEDRVADRVRLLEYLLEHEMAVAALLDPRGVPVESLHRPVDLRARNIEEPHTVRAHLGHVPVLQKDHPSGTVEQRGDV